MRRILITLLFGLIACSCDFHPIYRELDVNFQFCNVGVSDYAQIIVYAKDSSDNYVDSTSQIGNVERLQTTTLSISLPNLKYVRNGVWEVQAVMANGKFLRQEFGLIEGIETKKMKYKVALMDSTIIAK